MAYYLGVDGGATKTHALIADSDGRALGFGRGGASNHQTSGLQKSMREIETAARQALDTASLSPQDVEMGCFCLAGADLPEDYTLLDDAVGRLGLASQSIIKNDTVAALRAGLSGQWGVVVICGTGFNGAGRSPDGHETRFHGLGFISGDWAGGSALAEDIIRAVTRAQDGRGKPTLLTDLVLSALAVESEETLIERLYREEIPYRRLLDLVPLLFEAALQGDEVAADLITQTGVEVGVAANALIRRLDIAAMPVEVVLGGSVFKGRGPLLLDTVHRTVLAEAPQARLVRLRHEPVFGAVMLALEAAGIAISGELLDRLDKTVQQLDGYPQVETA